MSADPKRALGRILLQRKLVPKELLGALTEPKEAAPRSAPVEVTKEAAKRDTELDELRALADRSGAPALDLRLATIVLEHLDVVPVEVAEALHILPVLVREAGIYLAMVDPHDKRAVEEIEFVTGKTVYPFIAVKTTLRRTIAAAYGAKARGDREYRGSMA
ncbi:MAG TPA: hypothetical protein VGL81_35585 [Polyangiaceae bacterium]|jgi:hypothetical protein